MNKLKVDDMVFEALFRQVVIDDFNEEIDSIPTNEQLSKIYLFSPGFEIKMKRLFIKDRMRTFIKATMLYGRKVALIFTIVLGLLFGTLLFNTEVQATVGKVLTEWYENFTSFTFREDTTINEKKDWILNYLAKGYIEKNHEVLGNITNIEFVNSQDNKIRFSYRSEGSITNISVDNENHEIDSCIILGNEAFTIEAVNDGFDNGLIWNMDGHTFDLWGKVSIDELKEMAESISEK